MELNMSALRFGVGWSGACDSAFTMSPILISKIRACRPSNSRVRFALMAAGASLLLVAGATSCATTKGFGRDIEKTGEKIQEATR